MNVTQTELYQMSPQELTSVMLQALKYHYDSARSATIAERNRRLRQAHELLVKLHQGLSEGGGVVAAQLDEIYLYMARHTVEALVDQDIDKIHFLHELAIDLEDAWMNAVERTKLGEGRPFQQIKQSMYEGMNRYEDFE